MNNTVGTILTAGTLALAATVQGQRIENGSFEAPGHGIIWDSGPGGTIYGYKPAWAEGSRNYISITYYLPAGSSYLTGWTIGGAGLDYHVNNLPRHALASDGMYAINIANGGGGSISQSVTGLTPGHDYYVFFDSLARHLGPQTVVTVKFGSQTTTVQNTVSGSAQTLSLKFKAATATQTLTLAAPSSTGDAWIVVDNVRISETANGPVQLEAKHVIGVKVEGVIGKTYRVEYHSDVNRTDNYVFLKRVTLSATPTWVYDEVLTGSQRFYRSVEE